VKAITFVGRLSVLLAGISAASGQGSDELQQGRALVARITLDPATDQKIFSAIGRDRVLALLQAVEKQGASPAATPDDRADLHRAYAAQIELYESAGEFLKANIIALMQETMYRHLDRDYHAALDAARLALRLQERSGEKPGLMIAHRDIAEDLRSLGQKREALAEIRLAHDVDTARTTRSSAELWRQVVVFDIEAGDLDAARLEAARLADPANSAIPLQRSYALLAKSDLQIADGHFDDASESVAEALAAASDPKDREYLNLEASNQLMNCVVAATRLLSYDDALRLATRIDSHGQNMGFSLRSIVPGAMLVRKRAAGDLEGAVRIDHERLEQARTAKDVAGQIQILRSLGITYSVMHATTQQVALLEESLALARSAAKDQSLASPFESNLYLSILNTLGEAYTEAGELKQAGDCFDMVLKAASGIQSAKGRAAMERYASDARLDKARVLELAVRPEFQSGVEGSVDESREMLRNELKLRPDYSWALLQWARLERDQDQDPALAARLYASAVKAFGPDSDRHNQITLGLEVARYLAGEARTRVPNALPLARQQLEGVETEAVTLGFADASWQLLYTKGMIAEAEDRRDEAIRAYESAVQRIDQLRAGLSGEEQRQSFLDSSLIRGLYARLVGALAAAGRQSDAFQYLERGKARAFLEMLGGRRFRATVEEEPLLAPLRRIESQIYDLRAEISVASANASERGGAPPVRQQDELRILEGNFAEMRDQMDLSSTRAAQPLSLKPPSLDRVAKLLPQGTALVEYAFLDDQMMAFIVSQTGSIVRRWPMKKAAHAELMETIRALPESLRGEYAQPLSKISTLILEPVAAGIPRGIHHLVIVPSRELYSVPFQALKLPDGRDLIEAYDISYLPSAGTLDFLGSEAAGTGSVFVGALGDVSVQGYEGLPGTLREADAIAKVYPQARNMKGAAFTHDAARDALLHYDIVHLATHGLIDKQAPLFTSLLTSPAPGQPTQISLYEVTDLNVQAKLVVLSACQTGLGRLTAGDEIAGLTRTFLTAGASTVVSSLWSVADDSTAVLMQNFHESLSKGRSPAAAMREATLTVRRKYPRPYNWAPFIVTGAR
jgi:CHAT domain-containing protein/tetratricopeptide (TPR) repeat protein